MRVSSLDERFGSRSQRDDQQTHYGISNDYMAWQWTHSLENKTTELDDLCRGFRECDSANINWAYAVWMAPMFYCIYCMYDVRAQDVV